MNTPKAQLLQIKAETGYNIADLIVLAPANDPFNCGSKTDLENAKWFQGLFQRGGFKKGSHLRRIHYWAQSLKVDPILQTDGKPYENTEKCWEFMQKASKAARYLGLVDCSEFEDHRNPPPTVYSVPASAQETPNWEVERWWGFNLPHTLPGLDVTFSMPEPFVTGYTYTDGMQPYHLELWVEKSTMNDVLEPICRKYRANLCTSLGFQSYTSAVRLIERTAQLVEIRRPVRILYLADFDPGGEHMPFAVARHLEFRIRELGLTDQCDIKLTPIGLTREQVEQYQLPWKPIKESDLRKGNFEDRHGQGAVELDALEAIHPGELGRVVSEALAVYWDSSLSSRLSEARDDAVDLIEELVSEELADIETQCETLQEQVEEILEPYRTTFSTLSEELETALAPLRIKAIDLQLEIERRVSAIDNVDLPEIPTPATTTPDESDWLFDSSRNYFEQLEGYSNYKEGGE